MFNALIRGSLPLVASLAVVSCGRDRAAPGAGPAARPSILLVSVDTLRADHVGCYGARGAETPNLDALAAQGVLFERALTPVPITLPSHATLFTGLLPHRHGVRDNGLYRLPPEPPTLAGLLQAAGYDTAAVVAADVLDRQYGLNRGFRLYDDAVGARGLSIAERPAAAVTDAALRAAATLRAPFFLFVHYYDPHAAYRPPAPWAERFRERPYDGEVAYVDAELGRLLREVRARVPAVVVAVTSDHGEGLGEHGEATHGPFVYQATLRVPLIVAAPGRWPAARRVADLVSTADVLPTLLDLVGVTAPASLDGSSLVGTMGGKAQQPRALPIESEFGLNSYGWAPLYGITDGALKWIDAPEAELYDLGADATETRNLARERRADVKQLASLWRTAVAEDRRAVSVATGSKSVDADRMARLQSLGYVAGSRADETGPRKALPDPKRVIGSLELVNEARRHIGEGRFDAAIRTLETALRASPRNVSALILMGAAQLRSGRPRLALEPLRKAEAIAPLNADVPFNLGLACIGADDAPCAEKAFRRALELAPRYHDAAVNLIDLLLQTGRATEARAAYDAARGAGLESPLLDFLEGKLALQRGERLAAQGAFTRALRSGALPAAAAAEARRLLQNAPD